MAKERYLLCPQCGSHRLFIRTNDEDIYFHVTWEGEPVPTKESGSDLTGLDFSQIRCCGCSWIGAMRKLVRYITG